MELAGAFRIERRWKRERETDGRRRLRVKEEKRGRRVMRQAQRMPRAGSTWDLGRGAGISFSGSCLIIVVLENRLKEGISNEDAQFFPL